MTNTDYIGQGIARVDGKDKATGNAQYANDVNYPGQLYLKMLRSTVAHAKVLSIDTSEAEKLPGVVRIFTSKDIPGNNTVGRTKKDQPVLVSDKVRMVGDALALVAAETAEAAETALAKIIVKLEELKPVLGIDEALKDDAPQVHEDGNILFRMTLNRGDVQKAFAEADVIVENEYQTPRNDHAYMEPEAGLSYIDDEDRVVVLTPHQHPHQVRGEIAHVLGLPLEQVRVIHTVTGGGFGGKIDVCLEGFLALASYHLRKPVKMVLSRPESLAVSSKRLPVKVQYQTAARKDGKILGVKVKMLADNGAYAYSGMAVMRRAATHAAGPYEVNNVLIEALDVYTNNTIGGQMRGFGVTEIAVAHEMQMDEVARALNVDPIEIRIINGLKEGSQTITGQALPKSVGLVKTLEAVKKHEQELINSPTPAGMLKGIGVASMYYGIGKTGKSVPATVKTRYDGKYVTVYTGAAEIGQGSDTVLKQIAASAFKLPIDNVLLICGDTLSTPDSGPSSASRQTYMTGNAIVKLAQKVLEMWEQKSGTVGFIEEELTYVADTTAVDLNTSEGNPYESYAFATHLVKVLVDPGTGQVEVTKAIAAHDVGAAINPVLVEGQIEGGVVMGLGFGLLEEYWPGITNTFHEYTVPTILDSPEITSIIVEDRHPQGPYGAKGVGEPSMIPTAPAILNAIYDAVGVRVRDLPCTSEKIYIAMRKEGSLARIS